jgi:YD repeat-containing protein
MRFELLARASILAIALHSVPVLAQDVTSYRYDAKGRLTGSTASGSIRGIDSIYVWDAAGNRRELTVKEVGPTPAPSPTPTPTGLVANPDSATFDTREGCMGIWWDVLANDSDGNGHYPLKIVSVVSDDSYITTDGSAVQYSPFPRSSPGVVEANYIVKNAAGEQASARLTLNITGSDISCD